jgi:hypothetical protein
MKDINANRKYLLIGKNRTTGETTGSVVITGAVKAVKMAKRVESKGDRIVDIIPLAS